MIERPAMLPKQLANDFARERVHTSTASKRTLSLARLPLAYFLRPLLSAAFSQPVIASAAFALTSANVSPSVTQPGSAGTSASSRLRPLDEQRAQASRFTPPLQNGVVYDHLLAPFRHFAKLLLRQPHHIQRPIAVRRVQHFVIWRERQAADWARHRRVERYLSSAQVSDQ